MAQKILFPMQYMRITTGVNELSHKGSNAIDVAGKDQGKDKAYAPFTGTIKRIYPLGNTIWLESNEPVEFADGSVDYAVVNFTHDNDISNIKVGKVFQQGQEIYQEGTANAKGAHIHLEVGKGKYTGNGWYQNKYGNWVINNSYEPWKAFFITDDTIILNGYNYPWKKVEEDMRKPTREETQKYFKQFVVDALPTEEQITYYTNKGFDVLLGDLLQLNFDRNKEKDSTINSLKEQLSNGQKPAPSDAEKKLQAIKDSLGIK